MRPFAALTLAACTTLALADDTPPAGAAPKPATSAAAPQFEALKSLAGSWVRADAHGRPTDEVVSEWRLTAAGTAIVETLSPGSDHEMVTIYHLDGDALVLTHYCAYGNQPRMKARPAASGGEIVFECIGGTNMKSHDEPHMHSARLVLVDKDHYKAEWVGFENGKASHTGLFDVVRKP